MKLRVWSLPVFFRALIVLGIAGVIGTVTALYLRDSLNAQWRNAGDSLAYAIFYFFSDNWLVFVLGGLFLAFLCFSGWIFKPSLRKAIGNGAALISNIKAEGDEEAIRLPDYLADMEREINQVNQRILLLRYAAKEAEERKDELVAYMAHDLRTPLTSVLGYLELLEENPELPPTQREKFTEVALRKARRMQSLVEELFEITRFNISNIELDKQKIQPSILLRQLIEEIQPLLSERDITVTLHNSGLDEIFVDPDKFARAVDNILTNAARYAPEGETVEVDMAEENGRALISISNGGREIPAEKLDRFFDKFYRGDASRSGGGIGLGLAIARDIVRAHGGEISARCENAITTFTIIV